MHTYHRVSFAIAVAGVVACSGDTAIVLSIHTDDDQIATATRLDVAIGVGAVAPPTQVAGSLVTPRWWRRAPVTIAEDALAFPGGFGERVYELALYPGDELALDDELVFAVVAWQGDVNAQAPVGFAHSPDEVRFAEGQIRRFDVVLTAADQRSGPGVTATGCAWWRADPSDPLPSPVRDRAIVPADDADCDDFAVPPVGPAPDCDPLLDCNDGDPTVNPGAGQGCSTVDTDCCSESQPDVADVDDDGVPACAGDCNEDRPVMDAFGAVVLPAAIHPGVVDTTCNGVDEACAIDRGGRCDPGGADPDGDDWVTCVRGMQTAAVHVKSCRFFTGRRDCLEQGEVAAIANDGVLIEMRKAKDIHPDAEDLECDGVDDDCSGVCDDGGPADGDSDGFGACARRAVAGDDAPTCAVANSAPDCDDADPFGRPRPVVEACDGFDSRCDGVADTSFVGACVQSGGGLCQLGTATCTETFNGQPQTMCQLTMNAPRLPESVCLPCTAGGSPLGCQDGRFPICDAHTANGQPGMACADPAQDRHLAPCPTGQCVWTIVSPPMVGGWRIQLTDPTGATMPVGSSLTASEGAIRVLAVGDAAQTFVIKRAGLPDVYEIVILRRGAAGCQPMTCTSGG